MIRGIGYGKTILYGEHFVVYGVPSIACALKLKTTASVESCNSTVIEDKTLGETIRYGEDRFLTRIIDTILKEMGLTGESFKLTLQTQIPLESGMGSSAALAVAATRALNGYYQLGYPDEKINKIAYECEKVSHGNPSGIDNTVSTYGGVIWYERKNPPVIEQIKLSEPIRIVVGDTQITHDTKEVVSGVADRRENHPDKYQKIFSEARELALKGRKALREYNLEKIGELMDYNHQLLQEIQVSCKELDELCKIARDSGALGAKLTGAGKGGCMIALTPGKKLQEEVSDAIQAEGYPVIETLIGV